MELYAADAIVYCCSSDLLSWDFKLLSKVFFSGSSGLGMEINTHRS